jgi:hypothetical protein
LWRKPWKKVSLEMKALDEGFLNEKHPQIMRGVFYIATVQKNTILIVYVCHAYTP